ncbi:MAG: hypothetical protein ACRDO7_04585, partial [Nocardioidaceae bacterium]
AELVRRYVRSCLGSADPVIADALTTEDVDATPLPRWHRPSGRTGAMLDIARSRLTLGKVSPAP